MEVAPDFGFEGTAASSEDTDDLPSAAAKMQRRAEFAVSVAAAQALADDHFVEAGAKHTALDEMDPVADFKGNRGHTAKDDGLAATVDPAQQSLNSQLGRGQRIAMNVAADAGQILERIELVEVHQRVGFGGG